MVAVTDVAAALAPVLRTLVPAAGATVTDVVITEPGDAAPDHRGDLVVGAGVADADAARALVERSGAAGVAGVVLRPAAARARGVRSTARRAGVALLELDEDASLVHVVGVVRELLDRAAAPDPDTDPGGAGQLLQLADAAAALVDAPVTIEDAQSRVLAYSTRQDVTDTARVSTVLGRRVPAALVAHMRSRGVFRRLARSDEPFLVPPGPGQEMPRYVVPVRTGGEWLGSIWAVVGEAPPEHVVAELRRTASVVALHLLRDRAFADLSRRLGAERLRTLLAGGAVDPQTTGWLPAGPWRAVVLGTDLDVAESRLHRAGWRQPLVTTLDDQAYALVTVGGVPGRPDRPGSWGWLAALASSADDWVAAGPAVAAVGDVALSAALAAEVADLRRTDPGLGPTPTAEGCWATLTVRRAVRALPPEGVVSGGPVDVLADHDRRRHTAYLPSLAAWLDHPGEPTAAARALGVHVNTLRHRMVRMSEVVPLRLHDPTERLGLRLQLAAVGLTPQSTQWLSW